MSRYEDAHVLTAPRLEDLRRVASGATRRPDGSRFELQPIRRRWLAQHGYLDVRPAPAESTAEERRACVTVTAKGWKAIAVADDVAREGARP